VIKGTWHPAQVFDSITPPFINSLGRRFTQTSADPYLMASSKNLPLMPAENAKKNPKATVWLLWNFVS